MYTAASKWALIQAEFYRSETELFPVGNLYEETSTDQANI